MGQTLELQRGVSVKDTETPGVSVVTEAHSGWSTGWVARLMRDPNDPTERFDRAFLRPSETSLSRAGNGSKTYTDLEDGIYQAESVYRSYQSYRTCFRVTGDQVEILANDGESLDRVLSLLSGWTPAELAEARRQERERKAAAAAVSAAADREHGLPPLAGSEKQIAWATEIRRGLLSHLDDALAELLAAHDELSPSAQQELADAFALLRSEFSQRTEARWWIDHRDEYDWSSPRRMRHWAWEQAQERNLIPTMISEWEAARQARAENEARRDERRRNLLLTIRLVPESIHWDNAGTRITEVRDGDLRMTRTDSDRFTLADAGGELGALALYTAEAANLADRLKTLQTEAEQRQYAARLAQRHDSLRGVTVVAAQATRKRSENLTVTLSDGRVATGHHTAKATEITAVAEQSVTPDHPEVLRLTAEARKVVVRV